MAEIGERNWMRLKLNVVVARLIASTLTIIRLIDSPRLSSLFVCLEPTAKRFETDEM